MRTGCKFVFALPAALCLLLLSPTEAAGETRAVAGKAVASDGEPLIGAVVQIKNTRTLHIRTFVTQKDGSFHFFGLSPDVDYHAFARYRGRSSRTKTVSQFDSREVVTIHLVIRSETGP